MGTRWGRVVPLFALLFTLRALVGAQQVAPRPLITQPIDETHLVTLRGNTHPLAQPQYDIGQAAPDLPLNRMLLVLKRSPQQEYALRTLLDSQQDKNSPNYHRWLTPDEFGTTFGPADQDVQTVTNWLQSHGLQVNRISRGKTVIEFSGVESQVEAAFNTQIHSYMLPNGEQHWANATDPSIPAALVPAVAGVRSLNNFSVQHFSHVAGVFSRSSSGQIIPTQPQFTLGGRCGVQSSCYGVGPYDFATIYDIANSWSAATPIDGSGETIAIVGETDINPQDVADFRNYFGLPAYGQASGPTLNIIHSGPAPGILTDGEESEADLDVEWSGAVAKGASVDFVVAQSTETTQGIDLSALYIVDNNLAPVMSESYGQCELRIGPSGNQFFSNLWEQASAQGITVMLSSGDGSSAGCDNFDAPGPATLGLQVSGFASTPFNVAVGGTDFFDLTNASTYWNTSNAPTTQASAKSFIPETTWDDNCTNPVFGTLLGFSTNAEANCNNSQLINAGFVNIVGGSGGRSSCISSDGVNSSSCSGGYPKPSWQNAPGVPSDNVRDVPDVSLFAASGSPSGSFYIVCEADAVSGNPSCVPNNNSSHFIGIGGTSASSPAFAGIMALVNQKAQARQGNANFVLYKLAQLHPTVFHDVTTGTIEVPCATGSLNCTTSVAGDQFGILSGYNTTAGYDLATGIGSVDVGLLLQNWSSANFRPSLTTLALNPTTNLTHGQSVNVTSGVAPSTGSGTPTGDVSLLASNGLPAGTFTLANGQISGTTNLLPGGTYTVTAHYVGDTTFGGSDSPVVNVTIGKENSSPSIELVTFDWQGNETSANSTTAVYGTPYLLRVDVLNSAGNPCQVNNVLQSGCPTGNVALTDNGNALDAGSYVLNSLGYTEDQFPVLPGGNDSVKAQYAGDVSFNGSAATKSLNITPAPTSITASPSICCLSVGNPYQSAAVLTAQSNGVTPTGTFTFYVNGNPTPGSGATAWIPPTGYPPVVTYETNFFSSSSPFPVPGNYSLSASYSGDANYQAATSSAITVFVKYPSPTVTIQASPSPVNAGSMTNLTATVLGGSKTIAPTGTISFFSANTNALTQPITYATVTDSNTGNLDLQGTIRFAPTFTDGYFANYSGDANYQSGQANSAYFLQVNGNDFVLSARQNSATVGPGGTGFYQLFVGFQSNTAPVSFTCSGLPNESTCSVSPMSSTGTVSLQISTTASNAAAVGRASAHNSTYLWLSSMLPFAAILLIGYRRIGTKRSLTRVLLTLLLLFGIACGGGGSNGGGGGGGGGGGTPPAAPTSLIATAISSSKINLGWFPSTGATSYTVYRSTTNGFTPSASNQIASTNEESFYADSGLTPSTLYYYVLKAADSSGMSAASNQASATTQVFDPGTPAGTYNITVTGTSGTISHSVNLTLVVQ